VCVRDAVEEALNSTGGMKVDDRESFHSEITANKTETRQKGSVINFYSTYSVFLLSVSPLSGFGAQKLDY